MISSETNQKLENSQRSIKEWSKLLHNVDQMQKQDLNQISIKKKIQNQILKGILDQQIKHSLHEKINQVDISKFEQHKMIEHWKQQNLQRDHQQQQRQKKIRAASLFNKKSLEDAISHSQGLGFYKVFQQKQENSKLKDIYETQFRRKKARELEMKKFYQNQNSIKQKQKILEQQRQMNISHQKQRQAEEISYRRQKDLQRIRNQHQQNMLAFKNTQNILNYRKQQQKQLLDHIAIDGALEKQRNIMQQYRRSIQQQQRKKNQHVQTLKQQLQNDRIRSLEKQKRQREKDRYQINSSIMFFNEIQNRKRKQMSEHRKNLANTLEIQQNQKKYNTIFDNPLNQAEKIKMTRNLKVGQLNNSPEFVSSFHIGQFQYSDHKKQMNVIDRNLNDNLLRMHNQKMNQSMEISRNNSQPPKNPTKQVMEIKLDNINPQLRSSQSYRSNSTKKSEQVFRKAGNNILGAHISS